MDSDIIVKDLTWLHLTLTEIQVLSWLILLKLLNITSITNIAENPDWIDKQALSENDVPISGESEKPRQRKGHLARERSLLGLQGTHLPTPTADP